MKKYTISYEGGLDIETSKKTHKITHFICKSVVYANNDFEAGCKVARHMDFKDNATIESIEELKPIKVRYTYWNGVEDCKCEEVCYGTLEDAQRQIGGGMNCFDFELVEE